MLSLCHFQNYWNFDLDCKHREHKALFGPEKLSGHSRNGLLVRYGRKKLLMKDKFQLPVKQIRLFNKINITKSFECCCLYRCSCIIFFFSFHCYFLCVTLLLFRFSNGGRPRKLYFGLCEISNVAKVEISWSKEVHRFLDHWSSRWVASPQTSFGVRSSRIHF